MTGPRTLGFLAVAVVCTLGAAPRATAQSCPGKPLDPCGVLWSTEDVLSVRERELLDGICELTARGAEASAAARWRALSHDDRNSLLRRLAGWPLGASVLTQVLPEQLWTSGHTPIQGRLASFLNMSDSRTQARECRANAEEQLQAWGETVTPGSAREPELMSCIFAGGSSKKLEARKRQWRELFAEFAPAEDAPSVAEPPEPGASTLLVFVGGTDDRVDLVIGDPRPGVVRAELANTVQGLGVYLAVVPRGALVSVDVSRAQAGQGATSSGQPLLQRSHFLLPLSAHRSELVHWLDGERTGCLDLEVAIEPSSTIYLDSAQLGCEADIAGGEQQLVRHYRKYVSRDDWHDLAVVGRETGGRVMLKHRELSFEGVELGQCLSLRLDLRQQAFREAVALLGVETGALCAEAGVDRARLHYAIVQHFKDLGIRVKDIETWTDTITGLGTLKQALQALGGEAVGADRGRLNALSALGDGGQELLRQGFGQVLSASLECSQRDRHGWEYSLVARRLDIAELISTARDTVTGADLDEVVKSKVEFATERPRLRAALAKLLADLFDHPYLRLDELPRSSSYLDELDVGVEARAGGTSSGERGTVTIATRALPRAVAGRLCRRIELHGSLAGDRPEDAREGPWVERRFPKLRPQPTSRSAAFLPGEPGLHLVYVKLEEPQHAHMRTLAEDYACVEVRERPPIVWFDLLPLIAPFKTHDALGATMEALGVLASAGPPRSSLEAWLGYLRTSRHLQELPSWDDLGRASLPYARDGTLRNPYRIRADWLLFGAAWRVLDARFCNLIGGFACGHGWRRVGIVARLGFLGSVRSTDFSELPNSVQMARGDHVRLDAGFGVNTGLRYALSEGFSIRLLFHVLMPNLFDVIGEEGPSVLGQSHRQREADYDNRPLWALSVGFGFSSFPGVNP